MLPLPRKLDAFTCTISKTLSRRGFGGEGTVTARPIRRAIVPSCLDFEDTLSDPLNLSSEFCLGSHFDDRVGEMPKRLTSLTLFEVAQFRPGGLA